MTQETKKTKASSPAPAGNPAPAAGPLPRPQTSGSPKASKTGVASESALSSASEKQESLKADKPPSKKKSEIDAARQAKSEAAEGETAQNSALASAEARSAEAPAAEKLPPSEAPASADGAKTLPAPAQAAGAKEKPSQKSARKAFAPFAIVMAGGRQFKVQEGDFIEAPHMPQAKPKDRISLEALAIQSKERLFSGPFDNPAVEAVVLRHSKGKKTLVFKKKRRKGYRKTQGFRPLQTEIKISAIRQP